MAVDLTRAAEELDRVIASREQETILALRRYLDEAHRRLQRDIKRLYPDTLEEVRSEGRVFREARARVLLAQVETALEALRLGNPGTGAPQAMRDTITFGRQEGGQQVAEVVSRFEESPTALGLATNINFTAATAQTENAVRRLTRYSDEAIERVNQAVIDGLVRGSGIRDVSREIKKAIIAPDTLRPGERLPAGKLGGLAYRAETIARTELISSLEDAREEAMRDADIEHAMWVATDDDRTCRWCAGRDGDVYELQDIVLPAHPRCRCVTTPVRLEWIEEGLIDVDAVAEHQRETRRVFEETHGRDARYATGPTAFERAQGMDAKPKAVWTPGIGLAPRRAPAFREAQAVSEVRERMAAFTARYDLDDLPLPQQNAILRAVEAVSGGQALRLKRVGYLPRKAKHTALYNARKNEVLFRRDVVEDPAAHAARMKRSYEAKRARKLAQAEANVEKYGRPGDLAELQQIQETPRFLVLLDAPDPLAAIAQHEFMHAVDSATARGAVSQRYTAALNMAGVSRGSWHTVSEYAAANPRELFAEVGAAKLSGVPIPEEFLRVFEEVMDAE